MNRGYVGSLSDSGGRRVNRRKAGEKGGSRFLRPLIAEWDAQFMSRVGRAGVALSYEESRLVPGPNQDVGIHGLVDAVIADTSRAIVVTPLKFEYVADARCASKSQGRRIKP